MSKSVRLPDYLAAEVERLATAEKRSLANMVKVLLDQALALNQVAPVRSEVVTGDAPKEAGGVDRSVAVRVAGAATLEPRGKKRAHPCRHHVPPSRVCDYCDA